MVDALIEVQIELLLAASFCRLFFSFLYFLFFALYEEELPCLVKKKQKQKQFGEIKNKDRYLLFCVWGEWVGGEARFNARFMRDAFFLALCIRGSDDSGLVFLFIFCKFP